MGLFRSMGARKDSTRGTTALEVRKGLANLFMGPGVLPGADSPLVAGTAGWTYSVGKAGFVSTRGASDGVHLFGNDGTVTIGTTGVGSTVPVAPGAGLSRIDITWVSQPSASENSDTVSEPTFGVASGGAASSPIAPTIPTGALEIARNTMTSAATSTSSAGNTITQTAAAARLRTSAAWTSYAPALASSGVAPTLGTGGAQSGHWTQDGNTITGEALIYWGTGSTAGTGFYVINLPRDAATHGAASLRVGTVTLVKASTGAMVQADLVLINVGQAKMAYSTGLTTAAANAGAATPWVPAAGDTYFVRFIYETP